MKARLLSVLDLANLAWVAVYVVFVLLKKVTFKDVGDYLLLLAVAMAAWSAISGLRRQFLRGHP